MAEPPPEATGPRFSRILGFLVAMFVAAFGYTAYDMVAMPGSSRPSGACARAPDVQREASLKRHVNALARGACVAPTLADDPFGDCREGGILAAPYPRDLTHPDKLEAAAAYIEGQLTAMGIASSRQAVRVGDLVSSNVVATLGKPGAPLVVLGAHYDSHVTSATPGANDNASGVAALLELARVLQEGGAPGLLAAREVQVVFYTNEEPPYFNRRGRKQMGSEVHASSLEDAQRDVRLMLSLETLGNIWDHCDPEVEKRARQRFLSDAQRWVYSSSPDFVAFVGSDGSRDALRSLIGAFRERASVPSEGIALPEGMTYGAVSYSDHRSYADQGFPALMVTDTAFLRDVDPEGHNAYHDGEQVRAELRVSDTVDRLHLDTLAWLVRDLATALDADQSGA